MANLSLKSAEGEKKIGYWEVTLEISSQGRLLHGNDMLCFSILGSDVTGIHTGCMNWQTSDKLLLMELCSDDTDLSHLDNLILCTLAYSAENLLFDPLYLPIRDEVVKSMRSTKKHS